MKASRVKRNFDRIWAVRNATRRDQRKFRRFGFLSLLSFLRNFSHFSSHLSLILLANVKKRKSIYRNFFSSFSSFHAGWRLTKVMKMRNRRKAPTRAKAHTVIRQQLPISFPADEYRITRKDSWMSKASFFSTASNSTSNEIRYHKHFRYQSESIKLIRRFKKTPLDINNSRQTKELTTLSTRMLRACS